MTEWTTAAPAELAEALKTALLLPVEPVGVRLFRDAAEFDAWPAPHPEAPTFYCAAVRQAASGASLKLSLADISCDTSPRTLGLEQGFDDPGFVESYVSAGLYRDLSVAESVLSGVVTLSGIAGVAVAPLGSFEPAEPPDVVVLAAAPYAVMRISQAAGFHGDRMRSDSIGMHGICAEGTALPYATGEISISLLCSGTRYVAGWDEHLMAVGIPVGRLPMLVDGLLSTADRYEPDERKRLMRSACGCTSTVKGRAGQALGCLSDGSGYFCR